VPLQVASKSDLLAKYNRLADSITSVNTAVTMQLSAGSAYTGLLQQYHQVSGFILAQKPATVRVIGQAPVIGTNIFDMVSDGKTFSIYIPSKNEFLVGSAALERPSSKAVENLRPQHLTHAIFWQPVPDTEPVLFEQALDGTSSDYVLTVVKRGGGPADWEIARKISFERVGLTLARIETYGDDGQIDSDIHYADWEPFGGVEYPKQMTIARPMDGYTLTLTVTKLTPNDAIEANRFVLPQPRGAQLVRVGDDTGSGTQ
jgi:outer membrane lipoprotein-sorting protein